MAFSDRKSSKQVLSHEEDRCCRSDGASKDKMGCCSHGGSCNEHCVEDATERECAEPILDHEQYCSDGCCEPEAVSSRVDDGSNGSKDTGSFYEEIPLSKAHNDERPRIDQLASVSRAIDLCECDCGVKESIIETVAQAEDVKTEAVLEELPNFAVSGSPGKKKCCHKTTLQSTDRPKSLQQGCCSSSKGDSCKPSASQGMVERRSDCPVRRQRAHARYQALLEKGLCVCRSLIGNIPTCCSSGDQGQADSAIVSNQSRSASMSIRDSVVPRTGSADSSRKAKKISAHKTCCKSTSKSKESTVPACCSSKVESATVGEGARHNQCGSPEKCKDNEKVISSLSCNVAVAASVDGQAHKPLRSSSGLPSASSNDVETGDISSELVKFRITGMTCTGCVRKVSAILTATEGVSEVNINFLAAIGDFKLASSSFAPSDIIQQLEHKTGFKCLLDRTDLQKLSVLLSEHKVGELMNLLPAGVVSVQKIKKSNNHYEITFDPDRTGARSLFERSGSEGLAPLQDDETLAAGKKHLLRLCTSFIIATVFTIPLVVLEWSETPLSYKIRSGMVVTFATIVQIVAIPEFYMPALKSLIFSRVIEMDMLVVISITAAYLYSIVAFGLRHAGVELEQPEFFETSGLLITLVLLGRVVSAYAKHRAVAIVSLKSIQATRAMLLVGSDVEDIDARLLQYGDVIRIPPHTKIVTDGIVLSGTGLVDESMFTGESTGILKRMGDVLIAGTLNGDASLTARLTRLPGKNSITDIAGLVESALNTKPRVQDLADKIAGYFIPLVLAVASVVFIIWIVVSLKVLGRETGAAAGSAITYAIAVLAISCPCALGLAVPMVLVIGGGLAARSGIIIKKADAIANSHKVTDVVFDKTGTITCGDLQVQDSKLLSDKMARSDVSAIALGLVEDNQHPVSKAIAAYEKRKGVVAATLSCLQSLPGKGIEATQDSHKIRAGNANWLKVTSNMHVLARRKEGLTLFCLMIDQELVAIYSLRTPIRPEAVTVIQELSKHSITTHLISGDGKEAVAMVADQVGILPTNSRSSCSPGAKQAYVKTLMDEGRYVLFCGDGTNDAVAVAQANVGVQIGDTSDMTGSISDVVLLGGLDGVLGLLDISKRAYHRIVFNFAWSFIYNLFAILLAGGAFVKVRIPPAYAGLGELVSVLPVILAALSLLREQRRRRGRQEAN